MSAGQPPPLETVPACDLCQGTRLEDVYPASAVRRCRDCGFVFRSPRPSLEAIAAFYSRAEKYAHWLAELPGREAMWRERLALLRRHVTGGRLLDVGAGIGQFLRLARGEFEVDGTEISASAVALAASHHRITLRQGTLDTVEELPRGGYQAVTLFHVLEHVPSPRRTLARAAALLAPGGVLLVAVPNDGPLGWYRQARGGPAALGALLTGRAGRIGYAASPPLPPLVLEGPGATEELHLSHFSPPVLRRLVGDLGLEVRELRLDPCFPVDGWRR